MQKVGNWKLCVLQSPPGAHLQITDANQQNWKDFVTILKKCIEAMKNDPTLNNSCQTALYGMSKAIPDKALLREFCCIHQAAMLDTL